MPKPPPAPDTAPAIPPERDSELCKIVFGAVLSQILYARQGFAPSSFQAVSYTDLFTRPFEDVLSTGEMLRDFDQQILGGGDETAFFRANTRDYHLSNFLGIVMTDIFPMIEREELVKFRISFGRTQNTVGFQLAEFYTVVLRYKDDLKYDIDVWRAGVGGQHVSTDNVELRNLRDYLGRLPPLTGPIHCNLAFYATDRPQEPSIGVWEFNHTDFSKARLRLQQNANYSFQRIAHLELDVAPVPAAVSDAIDVEISEADTSEPPPVVDDCYDAEPSRAAPEPKQHRTKQTKPQPKVDYYEIESDEESSEFQPQSKKRRRKAQPKRPPAKGAKGARVSNARKKGTRRKIESPKKPRSPPTTESSRANTTSARNRKTAQDDDHFADDTTPAPGQRLSAVSKSLGPRRKAKPPLQIFEHPASDLTETQEITRDSQTLRGQDAKSGKRPVDDAAAHSVTKRSKTGDRPSDSSSSDEYGRLVDGSFSPSDMLATSEGSAVIVDHQTADQVVESDVDGTAGESSHIGQNEADNEQAPGSPTMPMEQPLGALISRRDSLIDPAILTSDSEDESKDSGSEKPFDNYVPSDD